MSNLYLIEEFYCPSFPPVALRIIHAVIKYALPPPGGGRQGGRGRDQKGINEEVGKNEMRRQKQGKDKSEDPESRFVIFLCPNCVFFPHNPHYTVLSACLQKNRQKLQNRKEPL